MTCSHCMKEYGNDVQVCPQCGGTLAYGGQSAPTGAFDPNGYVPGMQEHQMNLGTTVSVSGSHSIRGRLRPRSVPEIITEAFRLYKENWKLFAMVVAVFYVPAMILQYGWQEQYYKLINSVTKDMSAENVIPLLIWSLAFVVGDYSALFLTNYSLTRAVSDIYLGKKVELRDIIRPNNRIWGFVGASLICGIILITIMAICIFPIVAGLVGMMAHHSNREPMDAFAILLGVLSMLFGFSIVLPAVSVWFVAVWPAAVIEGKGSIGAITRGISLIRGFYWKAAGLLILTVLISSTIQQLIASPYIVAVMGSSFQQTIAAAGHNIPPTPYVPSAPVLALGTILTSLGCCIAMPLMMLPIVLFYYDLRIRKEGFDLQMLAEQLGYGVGGEQVLSR